MLIVVRSTLAQEAELPGSIRNLGLRDLSGRVKMKLGLYVVCTFRGMRRSQTLGARGRAEERRFLMGHFVGVALGSVSVLSVLYRAVGFCGSEQRDE